MLACLSEVWFSFSFCASFEPPAQSVPVFGREALFGLELTQVGAS